MPSPVWLPNRHIGGRDAAERAATPRQHSPRSGRHTAAAGLAVLRLLEQGMRASGDASQAHRSSGVEPVCQIARNLGPGSTRGAPTWRARAGGLAGCSLGTGWCSGSSGGRERCRPLGRAYLGLPSVRVQGDDDATIELATSPSGDRVLVAVATGSQPIGHHPAANQVGDDGLSPGAGQRNGLRSWAIRCGGVSGDFGCRFVCSFLAGPVSHTSGLVPSRGGCYRRERAARPASPAGSR